MAVLTGHHARWSAGGLLDNPMLTQEHWSFAWVNQFAPAPFASTDLRADQANLAVHWPVEANSRSINAEQRRAFLDDWYYRVHVSPATLDMGSVASVQAAPVYVWNAWFGAQTLTGISELESGLELSGQPAMPLLFVPLQERRWDLSVRPEGQPVVDTRVEWTFAGGVVVGLRVLATRLIAWPFVPDWADGLVERLIAATDVLQGESAVSQRRQLRLAPRREFDASMYIEGRERQQLDLMLFAWSARIWVMPIWPDIQLLVDGVAAGVSAIPRVTTDLDFRGDGLAMLRGEDAFTTETVEIDSVGVGGIQLKRPIQMSWPAGSRLYPARAAQLVEKPSLTKLSDTQISADVRFLVLEPSDWPAEMPATLYRGRPVWDVRPDDTEDLSHSFERLLSTLDNGMALPLVSDTADRGLTLLGQRWLEQGRAQRASLRSFIHAMCGRQKTVWVPTHMDDLTLAADAAGLAGALDVVNIGYARFSNGKPGRRDLRLELHGGVVLYRRITAATEISPAIERLALDSPLGIDVAVHQVTRISWMVLCRFESDTQEIEHQTDSEGLASWATVFREERDDEL